ncbi:MAG: tetratricopeptide repeat protein [Oscillatoria sp. SIO1A7]|nr:tetratricopeptide repeat protein [Oscillatoria sp. SIO1A7]
MKPTNFNSRAGLTIQDAYRPASEAELLSLYNSYPCVACGASTPVGESGKEWERVGESGKESEGAGESRRVGKIKQISHPIPPHPSPSHPIPPHPSPSHPIPLQLGSVFFVSLPKLCSCGYKNYIIFVLNNLMAGAGSTVPEAGEAIAEAEARGILPDPFLQEQLVAAKVALHQGRLDAATTINQSLTVLFPQFFLPFYNLGTIYSRQERYRESLEAYDEAIKRNPEHLESLANKAYLLFQLHRFREAGTTYELWRSLNREGTVVMAEEAGRFGTIKIIDDSETRSLWIEAQLQGRVYKQPGANEWESASRSGPGPISNNFFAAGFLLVGCLQPEASGLVLGLGCGAGIAMSLACFPNLHLTVVEVDPTILRLCLTFFPMVQHYIDAGRLEIVQAEAEEFLRENDRSFDFLQCDVYEGRSQLPPLFASKEAIQRLTATAPLIFANIIAQLNEPHLHRVLAAFDAAGKPFRMLYPSKDIASAEATPINWLALTQEATISADFVPFAGQTGVEVETVRRNFATLQKNAVSRETVSSYYMEGGGEMG